MKREILCNKCRASLVGKLGHYPGEGHKFVSGKSRGGIICDACCTELPEGADCHALSIWNESRPYYEWESEFIRKNEFES